MWQWLILKIFLLSNFNAFCNTTFKWTKWEKEKMKMPFVHQIQLRRNRGSDVHDKDGMKTYKQLLVKLFLVMGVFLHYKYYKFSSTHIPPPQHTHSAVDSGEAILYRYFLFFLQALTWNPVCINHQPYILLSEAVLFFLNQICQFPIFTTKLTVRCLD